MAKIIQFNGWYEADKKERQINLNADHITTIDKKDGGSCINIESYNNDVYARSIHTKLSVDEIIKLVNT